jgi:hypothetical protein
MKAFMVAIGLLLTTAALAQSEQKVKMIRSGREAVDDANAVAQGVHKREAAPSADGDAGTVAKEAKPRPTPEQK